jgi:large subunit ribosomal protein L35
MPKLKTKKAASKRFKVKPSGKIKRASASKEHILTKKSKDRKNRLKKGGYISKADMALVTRCLPYG